MAASSSDYYWRHLPVGHLVSIDAEYEIEMAQLLDELHRVGRRKRRATDAAEYYHATSTHECCCSRGRWLAGAHGAIRGEILKRQLLDTLRIVSDAHTM